MKMFSFMLILWYIVGDLIPSAVIQTHLCFPLKVLSSRNTVISQCEP